MEVKMRGEVAERKLWADHPNPIAAAAERRFYLGGARKMEEIRKEAFKRLGLR